MNISIAIPTLGRDEVLINTINELLGLAITAEEILVIDQSDHHNYITESNLKRWHLDGKIRWIRIQYKSITRAMNIALRHARSERVLFLDDDIIPDRDLVKAHLDASAVNTTAIIAGRVIQPWHNDKADDENLPFLFNSVQKRRVSSFMAGNVSIPRKKAIQIGGFDTNFVKVAYHFEAEFSHRWVSSGNQIYYEPTAIIHHLKTERGGTRTYGNHLTTLKPDHAVGRHYYYLCKYSPKYSYRYSIRDLRSCILTKHHFKNPIWIPFSLIAEITGFIWAYLLFWSGRGEIIDEKESLLVVVSHPIQYFSPVFRMLDRTHLFNSTVFYLTLPDAKSQSLGFQHNFVWDIPLLDEYTYSVAESFQGQGLSYGFMGVRIKNPMAEIRRISACGKPDAVLVTGWHFWGMVQMFIALKLSNIPIILRMDSNALRDRNFLLRSVYRLFFSWVDLCLTVGTLNREFCIQSGMSPDRIIDSPHVVDNAFFHSKSQTAKRRISELRDNWSIPLNSFCFLYVGKLQDKKRPQDLLNAFKKACENSSNKLHLLIVGTGPLEENCRHFASVHKLPISFAGFVNQASMPEVYGISDCIILPSDQGETWGLVINEAMACGLPAIVSKKVGCCKDLIIDEQTGLSYDCGDVHKLAEKMLSMSNNIEATRSMGRNAQKMIFSEYTIEKVVQSIEQAMSRINGLS